MTRLKESTPKQLLLVGILLAGVMYLSWTKFPNMRIWVHSFRLNFDMWEPADIVGDMIDCKHPAVIKVLVQHLDDRRSLSDKSLERWPDFDGERFGEFCHYQISELAYHIDLSRGPDEDRIAKQEFMTWLNANYGKLTWSEDDGEFVLPGDSE